MLTFCFYSIIISIKIYFTLFILRNNIIYNTKHIIKEKHLFYGVIFINKLE